jgi:hypothetical protein
MALQYFLTADPGRFGPFDPKEGGNALMTYLPMASQGYALRSTIIKLFYIYFNANNLEDQQNAQFIQSDDLMNAAFGGDIPAGFYPFRWSDGKLDKMPMDQAVSRGFIPAPINTYQVIQATHTDFDPGRFNKYFTQNIAAANYYSSVDIPTLEINQALERDDIRAAMFQEYKIVKDVSAKWQAIARERKTQRVARRRRGTEIL